MYIDAVYYDRQGYRQVWERAVHDMPWTQDTSAEVDFIVDLASAHEPRCVLDVACGAGRHAIELARRGHRVVGVDCSAALVEHARRAVAEAGVNGVRFEEMDIRALPYVAEFDLVLSLWEGAIGYLETEEDNRRALAALARAVAPGGHHVAGPLLNADCLAVRSPFQIWERSDQVIELAELSWDREGRRVMDRTSRLRRRPDGAWAFEVENQEVRYRVYSPTELAMILRELGLEPQGLYRSPSRTRGVDAGDMEYWIHSVKPL